jgi:hypothetical protein
LIWLRRRRRRKAGKGKEEDEDEDEEKEDAFAVCLCIRTRLPDLGFAYRGPITHTHFYHRNKFTLGTSKFIAKSETNPACVPQLAKTVQIRPHNGLGVISADMTPM